MSQTISQLLVCCALYAGLGCQTLPEKQLLPVLSTDKAPRLTLRMVAGSSSRVVSHSDRGSQVAFSDERPDTERRYYPGLSQPRHWPDAISMLPMEAFDPGLEEQIQAGISERCRRESPAIQIQLTSFQFAFDQREETRGVFLADSANWQVERERADRERDQHGEEAREDEDEQKEFWRELDRETGRHRDDTSWKGLAGELAGEFLGFVLVAAGKVLLIETPRALWHAGEEELRTTAAEQQTPESITRDKKSGLNCQIEAVMTRQGSGRPQQVLITVCRHVPRIHDVPLQAQIAQLVEESIDEFCERVVMAPDE